MRGRFHESSGEGEATPRADGATAPRNSQAGAASGAKALAIASALLLTIGCGRAPLAQHASSADILALPESLQEEIGAILTDRCGTVQAPKMMGDASFTVERLGKASENYARRCLACHGVSGDGNGPAAVTLIPKPRDYRKGVFKFTSTPYGQRPRREDLVRTIRRGIPGTSMPSFELLPKDEIDALAEYVQVLAMRGEYQSALALEAPEYWDDAVSAVREEKKPIDLEKASREFRKAFIPVAGESLVAIVGRWEKANEQIVTPSTPQPVFTAERVVRGRALFLDQAAGCMKCHGADGRGQTPENLRGDLKDAWGHPTQAADLTSGLLRGGSEPIDIYRRIHSGINGTPMPAFSNIFAKEPDRIWDAVAYVLYLSNERRRGNTPDAAIGAMPGLRAAARVVTSPTAVATSGRGDRSDPADSRRAEAAP